MKKELFVMSALFSAVLFSAVLLLAGCASETPAKPVSTGRIATKTTPVSKPPSVWGSQRGNGGCVITGYKGSETAITLPETIDGVPVVGIGIRAFYRKTALTSVTIPDSVTTIGDAAFAGTPLTSVTIPDSVTTIGTSAFAVTQLTSVSLPKSVTAIGTSAFGSCPNLTAIAVDVQNPTFSSVDGVLFSKDMKTLITYPCGKQSSNYTIPKSVTTIGAEAFAGALITNVTIPNSVTSIGASAFAGTALTSVTLPNNVTTIGASAFSRTLLTSVTLPNSVTSIGASAFAGIPFTSVTLPKSVTIIGASAFAGIPSTSVTPPKSVTTIGTSASPRPPLTSVTPPKSAISTPVWVSERGDGGCVITGYKGSETAITIPETIDGVPVVGIGIWAFYLKTSLTSVTIPGSVTTIGKYAFSSCSSLTAIAVDVRHPAFSSVDGVLFSKDMKMLIAYPSGKSGSYTIPNGVTSIGEHAFYGTQLTSVTIPNGVISIGERAFGSCSNLTAIVVDVRHPAFSSVDGVLFSKDMKTLIAYPCGKQSSSYTIPNSVTTIGDYAFAGSQLTSITIPNGVTSIGNMAFGETQLTSVTIGNSVTSIGEYAFYGALFTSVTIPNSVTAIERKAFGGCSSLTAIAVDVRHPAFSSVDGVLFSKDMKTLVAYPGGKKSSSYTIPNGVTFIGDAAFNGTQLTSVTIGNSVTSIGIAAFGYTQLTSVTIPNSVASIGERAFENTKLTSVTIPRAAVLGKGAFDERVEIIRR